MITGDYMRSLRKEARMTQEELAKRVGISQAHIAKIENEKVNPTLSTVNKIMNVLKSSQTIKSKKLMVKKVISVAPKDSVYKTVRLMRKHDISQLPVIKDGLCIGCINEKVVLKNLDRDLASAAVEDIMAEPLPIVSAGNNLDMIKLLLEHQPAVLISDRGKIIGIITKSDLLSLLK